MRLPPEAYEIVVGYSSNSLVYFINGDRFSLSGYSFDYSETDTQAVLSIDGAIQSPDFTGTAVIETTQPLTINLLDDSGSGIFKIYGRENRLIRIDYLGNSIVRVRVDLDGALDDADQRSFEIDEEGLLWDYFPAI